MHPSVILERVSLLLFLKNSNRNYEYMSVLYVFFTSFSLYPFLVNRVISPEKKTKSLLVNQDVKLTDIIFS
jgi:hypothetical protein